MANRIFLIAANSGPPLMQDVSENQILCAANYGMPVCWCSLFDDDSIVIKNEPCENGDDDASYECLVTNTHQAIERARSRWPIIEPVFGREYREAFAYFCQFLSLNAPINIQCETAEHCMMCDEDEFKSLIREYLHAFDRSPLAADGRLSKSWINLFGQMKSIRTAASIQEQRVRLFGYSWTHNVPWENG